MKCKQAGYEGRPVAPSTNISTTCGERARTRTATKTTTTTTQPDHKIPCIIFPQSATYKKLAIGANRRHFNPVHTQKFPFLKMCFNVHPSTARSSPEGFRHKILYGFLVSSAQYSLSHASHCSGLDHPNRLNMWYGVQIMDLLVTQAIDNITCT